ncbi:MAG: hypothetical protein BGO10_10185 [Chlamydia sp. 32-24]|nr:MAG: hypothetical protein BGO10_10185 [Chlamydia sp. 32-24]
MNKSLKECLLLFHVAELKELASCLCLHVKGTKMALVHRILHFLETGEKISISTLPSISRAIRGKSYLLSENELMLKGSYKNDLKTRLFFKQLIGDHFHFTAFGIDWLNERWIEGKPPTYLEFAKMWQSEYERRKITSVEPKEEWAYINFVQKSLQDNPKISKEKINQLWEKERQKCKHDVYKWIDQNCPK